MKKKIIIGIICAVAIVCVITGILYLSPRPQNKVHDNSMISTETEDDMEDTGLEEQQETDSNVKDAETDLEPDNSTDAKNGNDTNKNTVSDPQNSAEPSENAIELPIDIIEDDEPVVSEPDENAGNNSGTVVPDNGNELPVDWIK